MGPNSKLHLSGRFLFLCGHPGRVLYPDISVFMLVIEFSVCCVAVVTLVVFFEKTFWVACS